MTDLALTEDQKQYQDLARDFTANEIATQAALLDHECGSTTELWRKAFDVGLLSVRIPERFGGAGMSTQDACVIAEEIAFGCTGVGATFEANEIAQAPLLVAGTDDQCRLFLSPLTSSFAVAGVFLQNGFIGGSGDIAVTCTADGGDYVLSGTSLAANAGEAAWYFALARDNNANTVSAFIIPADQLGITFGARSQRLGRRCAAIAEITLDGVRVPGSHLIGQPGQGLALAQKAYIAAAPLTASQSIGLARAALEHAIRYAKERTTFGQQIAAYQSVSFMLSDIARQIEAGRLLMRLAGYLADNQKGTLAASLAACTQATETAIKAATDAVQIFGGYGYSREYPVEKLMRDAKVLQMLAFASAHPSRDLGLTLLTCS